MSSINKNNFISLSSICITFISFSCLIALARPSSIMLNIRMDICVFFWLGGKIMQPAAVRGVAKSWTWLSDRTEMNWWYSPWLFHRCLLSDWRSFLLFMFVEYFYQKRWIEFCHKLFLCLSRWLCVCGFCPYSIDVVYYTNWFSDVSVEFLG